MKKLSSKLAAFLLIAVMVVSLFPASVFADDTDAEGGDTSNTTFSAYAVEGAEDIQEELELLDETDPEAVIPDLNAGAFYQEYTVGDLKVTVSYEAGTVPEGTEVIVTDAKPEAVEAIKAEKGEDISYAGADISFVFEGKEIEPKDFSDNKVTVTLEYVGEEDLTGSGFETLHVNETLDENGTVVYDVETVNASMEDVTKTVTKYMEVPVYETREITEERTTMVTKTREVEKTKTVKVKVKVKWYDPSTWLGYKTQTQKYTVTETYEEPVTETVVVGTEEVQVGTETVEDGTEEIVVGQTAVFETGEFTTFTITWDAGTSSSSSYLVFYSNNTVRVYATIHYVDTNGNPISRPDGIDDYVYRQLSGNNWNTVTFQGDEIAGSIPGYTYQGAFINSQLTVAATSISARRNNSTNYYRIYNGNSQIDDDDSGSRLYAGDFYLVYSGSPTESTVTVHYVDENGNELTVSNPDGTHPNLDETSSSPAFLIYDIDNYEYAYTYRNDNTTANRIAPLLTKNNQNHWQYMGADSTSTNELSNGDNIYVVYKKKADATTGGTPQLDPQEEWPSGDDAPKFSKSSTNNGNGTNTVSLSIVAGAEPVESDTPADVIVIFDVSGSMKNNIAGTGWPANDGNYYTGDTWNAQLITDTRLSRAKTAVNTMADTLLNKSDNDIRMALISFSTSAETVQDFTDSYNTFSGKVNGLSADGGTNWEKALQLANEMEVRDDAATFVVFVTDGDPTFRVSRGDEENVDLDMYTGSTYQAYRLNQVFGNGQTDPDNHNFDFAVDQVSAINGKNKNFYAIGISNDVEKVKDLTTGGGVAADHAFLASDEDAMESAFTAITESIKSILGFGDVGLTDGITELSNTRMEMMHGVDENSFKYYKTDSTGRHEWTTLEADGCNPATYDEETGAVEWNMGPNFQLEDGVTYTVTFTVWPSQEAYDLVASLNNSMVFYDYAAYQAAGGELSEDEARAEGLIITADQKAQIDDVDGTYYLKTNTDNVKASYKKTTQTGDVVAIADDTPVEIDVNYGTVQNMELESMQLTIKKEFEDDLTAGEDRETEVELVLKRRNAHQTPAEAFVDYPVPQGGGASSPTIVLNEDNNWTYSLYVAPGVEVDGATLEHGYDFTITEPGIDYHYNLVEEIINPMVVDGVDTYYGDGYLIIDKETVEEYIDRSLTAVNRVKSGIDIRKTVVDEHGVEVFSDEEFTITGKILDPNGNAYTFNNAEWDQRSDKNSRTWVPASASVHQNDPIAYHKYVEDPNAVPGTNGAIEVDGKTYRRTIYKGHFDSTADIEFTLKSNELLRFINVPDGCTFEFEEDADKMPENYVWDSSIGKTQHKTEPGGPFTPEGDVQPTVDEETGKVSLVKSDTCTGVAGNKQYTVIFKNKSVKGDMFYVYHSSDNTIEKIFTDDERVTTDYDPETQTNTYTFDIAAEVKGGDGEIPTHLYGGYFKAYGGQVKTDAEIISSEFDENNWASDTNTAVPYTGSKATAWKAANAYTVKGTAMHPVGGTVYYLKEVPNSYLRPYVQIVYDENDDNKILKLYRITALDDANYTQAGFFDGSADASSTKLSATLKITKNGKTVTTLTAKGVFDGKAYPDGNTAVPRGFLTSIEQELTGFSMQPYWKTLDGVKVYGVTDRTVNIGNGYFTPDADGKAAEPGLTISNVTNVKSVE